MKFLIILVFIFATALRFLYFPNNIYFGYDQARDAFSAGAILKGDLKLIGPSTSVEGLYHGVVYDYLIAPIYFIGQGNPEYPAAALRLINAMGVFLIYYFGFILFGKLVGIIAAIFFALSFEQTQFAIYLSNPALASLTVPLMFLGLALVIFKKKNYGLYIAFFNLGLSIQFEFALLYLIAPFVLLLIFFYQSFLKVPIKNWLVALIFFGVSISTFILADLKYSFRTVKTLISYSSPETSLGIIEKIQAYFYTINKMGEFNIYNGFSLSIFIWVTLLIFLILFLLRREFFKRVIFLAFCFFSLIFVYLTKGGYSDLYYTNIGVSFSLLIFLSLIIANVIKKNLVLAILLTILIAFANLNLITKFNHKGTISQIHVQQGMLLGDEKRIVDKIYQDGGGKELAVKAVTMPYQIYTTWSYVFEWYGKGKYGYLPLWNGKSALGFPGNLKIEEKQEKLPPKRYLIIEPVRGVPSYLIEDYIKDENYFSKIIKEEKIGDFILQTRVKLDSSIN